MIRSNAGANFTSPECKEWCEKKKISLAIAGTKYQEQNAFAESSYKTVSHVAKAMFLSAHLSLAFFFLALKCACKIMIFLPIKEQEKHPLR